MTGLLGVLGGIGSVLGGLGGLFNKPKTITSGQNLMSLAQGARDASAATGFNPLTLLQAGAGTTAVTTGGVPPLASIELITGGLQGLDDQFSGDAARRRAADQLNLDLARLRYDQARSGVVQAPLSQADAFPTLSPLGAKSVQVYAADGQTFGGHDAGKIGGPARTDSVGNDATRYVVGGVRLEPHPEWSDAQVIENRHGDLISSFYGVGTAMADVFRANRDSQSASARAQVDALASKPVSWDNIPQAHPEKDDATLAGRRHAYDWKKRLLKQSQGN